MMIMPPKIFFTRSWAANPMATPIVAVNARMEAIGGRKTATRIKVREPIQARILMTGINPLIVIRRFVLLSPQADNRTEMIRINR